MDKRQESEKNQSISENNHSNKNGRDKEKTRERERWQNNARTECISLEEQPQQKKNANVISYV